MTAVTGWQARRAKAVTRWYVERYWGTADDVGVIETFFDAAKVGAFSITRGAFERGEHGALFKLLLATVMFQRRQDVQIMRVLKNMAPPQVSALTDDEGLLTSARATGCDAVSDQGALLARCDLGKDPTTKLGRCDHNPSCTCPLKAHTVWLKRYGHFGKVPTSLAMMVEAHGGDLPTLYQRAVEAAEDEAAAARALERALSAAWRVSDKIAAMYLSMLCNPHLCPGVTPPWAQGVDAGRFIVIDSNVDLFLRAIGYDGPWSYRARRDFLSALSQRVRLDELDPRLPRHDARVMQQAMYLFMSTSNRRASPRDCGHDAPRACASCPAAARTICPRREA